MAQLGDTTIIGDLNVTGDIRGKNINSDSGSDTFNWDINRIDDLLPDLANWGLRSYDYGSPSNSELKTYLTTVDSKLGKTPLDLLDGLSKNGTILKAYIHSTADRRSYYNKLFYVNYTSIYDYSGFMYEFTLLNEDVEFYFSIQDGVYQWNTYKDSGGVACLTGDTIVWIGDNEYKKIKNLQVGDKVQSLNEKTNKIELKQITKIISHDRNFIYDISTQKNKISATGSHRFYTQEGIKNAKDIRTKDLLIDRDGNELKVGNYIKRYYEDPITVYEIIVEDNNNYYIGKDKILTHCEDVEE